MYAHFHNYKKPIKKRHFHLKNLFSYIHENTKNKKYKYHTESGHKIQIELPKNRIPHLLGLHYIEIKNFDKLKGNYAVDLIENESIKANDIISHDKFNSIRDRIFYAHAIPKILEEANCLTFDATKVKAGNGLFSNLFEISLFIENLDIELKVYMGFKNIKETENTHYYEATTFIVDRKDIYKKGTKEIKIEKINIENY